jgi:hypothetical protein
MGLSDELLEGRGAHPFREGGIVDADFVGGRFEKLHDSLL